jgi:hypothetical protein
LVTGSLAHTQGCLGSNRHTRVLANGHGPDRGLQAFGGAAPCFSGDGAEGCLSGNVLAHAFGTALRSADHGVGSRERAWTEECFEADRMPRRFLRYRRCRRR